MARHAVEVISNLDYVRLLRSQAQIKVQIFNHECVVTTGNSKNVLGDIPMVSVVNIVDPCSDIIYATMVAKDTDVNDEDDEDSDYVDCRMPFYIMMCSYNGYSHYALSKNHRSLDSVFDHRPEQLNYRIATIATAYRLVKELAKVKHEAYEYFVFTNELLRLSSTVTNCRTEIDFTDSDVHVTLYVDSLEITVQEEKLGSSIYVRDNRKTIMHFKNAAHDQTVFDQALDEILKRVNAIVIRCLAVVRFKNGAVAVIKESAEYKSYVGEWQISDPILMADPQSLE